MASSVILVIVIAVTSAVNAGQQHALEAHQRIMASLVASEMLGRVSTDDYGDLLTWNGYTEAVGSMKGLDGLPLPDAYAMIGRNVQVTQEIKSIPEIGVNIQGRTISVRTFDADNRTLAVAELFVPEPGS